MSNGSKKIDSKFKEKFEFLTKTVNFRSLGLINIKRSQFTLPIAGA